jgi:hypothetical protein
MFNQAFWFKVGCRVVYGVFPPTTAFERNQCLQHITITPHSGSCLGFECTFGITSAARKKLTDPPQKRNDEDIWYELRKRRSGLNFAMMRYGTVPFFS